MNKYGSVSTSSNNAILTIYMERLLDSLKYETTRDSTARTYYNVWKNFNKFIIKLDVKPKSWECGASLFGAYLVDNGSQSCTIKTYISAIKGS